MNKIKIIIGYKKQLNSVYRNFSKSNNAKKHANKLLAEKKKKLFFEKLNVVKSRKLFDNQTFNLRSFKSNEVYSLHFEKNKRDKKLQTQKLLTKLRKQKEIDYAEVDAEVNFFRPIKNNFQTNEENIDPYKLINFKPELNISPIIGGKEKNKIIVAVLDSGINYNHNHLKSNLWSENIENKTVYGFNYTNENRIKDSQVLDDNGHGTHISGIIAANGKKLKGISTNTKILSLKINPVAVTDKILVSDICDAMRTALKLGASVLNCSWYINLDNTQYITLNDTLKHLKHYNCIPVFMAGNDERCISKVYPQNNKNVITVGSLKDKTQKSDFSNFGENVTIWAPGENILSTFIGEEKNSFEKLSGTSMATPFVVGTIALLKERNKNLNLEEIKKKLKVGDSIKIENNKSFILNVLESYKSI